MSAGLTCVSSCEANAFSKSDELRAYDRVLIAVGEYFRQASSLDEDRKVEITHLPPIYFQHPGNWDPLPCPFVRC